ncbi:ataxin-7-like protein 1 isoform X4 [Salmo salar]|uniref:Ataxin-7-like protein 1 isoform X4 n=1 Tax=Salmo salar TaxID=8030 RepID=A0ABM3DA60_SALSA|nr:ataxin-7-like protein 1 isoform X4 [Salmo salar]XP_045555682.1 ataxin-7-like protein 1 isoform X4 [Salmo salar]XP_045555683.1 ataxin-7-like protein 1 isoform X4 [Salmo salar]
MWQCPPPRVLLPLCPSGSPETTPASTRPRSLSTLPRVSAARHSGVSLPVVSLEKMPCLGHAEGGTHVRVHCFSSTPSCSSPSSLKPSLTPPAPLRGSQEKLVNGRGPTTPCSSTPPSSVDRRPSPARSPVDKRPSSTLSPLDHRRPSASHSPSPRTPATLSPLDRKQQNGTKTPRPHRRLSGRVFDPNKHCGVQDPESKRSCTRSLTCKTHSLIHRRAVPGRQKEFDILLAEHKGRAKEGAKEKEKEGGQRRESQGGSQSTPANDTTPSTLPPHCHNGRTVSTLKLRLANAHIPRVPGGGGAAVLSSTPVPPASTQDPPAPVWQRAGEDRDGRLSSYEGDPGTPEDPDRDVDGDRPSCHYSPHHPRPLACCAFSSRLMGRGHYVFDRRWDRMRLALHCMVEKHVNAQMWRKVPLAAESPPSPSSLTPPPPLSSPSFPSSTNGAFSFGSYSTAFPQNASATGLFGIRDPSQPLAPISTLGKPRNGTSTKPIRPPGATGGAAKKRRTTLPPSSDTLRGNNNRSYHTLTPTPVLSSGVPPLSGRRKTLGHSASEVGVRAEDWYSNPDPTTTTPYSLTTDHPSPLPPPSPLAYGGGVDGRKRRSPSAYGGGGKPSKVTKAAAGLDGIFRRNSTGLLASGPESPRQSKLHH